MENTIAKKASINVETNLEALTVTFIGADGKKLEVSAMDLSKDIRTQAMLHGIKQKLVDAAAIARDPNTGKSATLDAKFQAINEVLERLKKDEWNKKREGGTSEGGILLTALTRIYKDRDANDVKEWLSHLSSKEKAAIRLDVNVAKVIQEIQAERKPSDIDVTSLLDGLKAKKEAKKK